MARLKFSPRNLKKQETWPSKVPGAFARPRLASCTKRTHKQSWGWQAVPQQIWSKKNWSTIFQLPKRKTIQCQAIGAAVWCLRCVAVLCFNSAMEPLVEIARPSSLYGEKVRSTGIHGNRKETWDESRMATCSYQASLLLWREKTFCVVCLCWFPGGLKIVVHIRGYSGFCPRKLSTFRAGLLAT